MKRKKNSIIIVTVILMLAIIFSVMFISKNNTKETFIKYSEYDYIKDRINDYNDVYSKNIGSNNSSILILEDSTNLVLMITLPRQSDGGKDAGMVDFTNMKMQNISYNKYGSEIIRAEMNIDKDYTISSASTYLYSNSRNKTYTTIDTEWKQIQQIARNIGSGLDTIIKGTDGKTIEIFGKTVQELKNTEHI